MSDLHPIFAECVRIGSPLDIERPFVIGPHVYATDSCICVRAAAGDRAAPADRKHVPAADRLDWPAAAPPGQPVPLPDVGEAVTKCDECEGTGWADGYACPECDGNGKYGDPTGVDVGPVLLGKKYVALLRRHGVTSAWPLNVSGTRRGRKTSDLPAVYFVGGGFEGLLMGIKPPMGDDRPAIRVAKK